jgi:diaminopimelate epimerase
MLRFAKMEGLGNDYLYINNLVEQIPDEQLPELARRMSDRHFGVGSDGIILVGAPSLPDHHFRFRIFNADGSEGEMCGNGMRCFARYCYDRDLTQETRLAVETKAGTIRAEILLGATGGVTAVRVDLGAPRFRRGEIPVSGPAEAEAMDESLEAGGEVYLGDALSMGNPHLVIWVDDVEQVALEQTGPLLERHPRFPNRVNVHFVQALGRSELKMRTWERGSGITLACGTGAAAVLVASCRKGLVGRSATVHLPGGMLQVEWDEETGHVFKTGPAQFVCDGVWLRER